jgi:hypothetical protein
VPDFFLSMNNDIGSYSLTVFHCRIHCLDITMLFLATVHRILAMGLEFKGIYPLVFCTPSHTRGGLDSTSDP